MPSLRTMMVLLAVALSSSFSPALADDNAKVKELLKERLAVLTELAANTQKGYQTGQIPLVQVLHANEEVIAASLELAETDKERIELLAKAVDLAKMVEEQTQKLFELKQVSRLEILRAKAARLQAEIALERGKKGKAPQ